jgi:hypothetical protein
MRKSVPDEGLLLRNSFFYEPEDAFDLAEREKPKEPFRPLSLDFFDPVHRTDFTDDCKYSTQLIKLPMRAELT